MISRAFQLKMNRFSRFWAALDAEVESGRARQDESGNWQVALSADNWSESMPPICAAIHLGHDVGGIA